MTGESEGGAEVGALGTRLESIAALAVVQSHLFSLTLSLSSFSDQALFYFDSFLSLVTHGFTSLLK